MTEEQAAVDRHNTCQCCRQVIPVDDFIKYLWLCMYCSEKCNRADGKCIKGLCHCEGGCCVDHKPGEQCEDAAAIVFGVLGAIAREVCVSCGSELLKRMITP
jgi:hypothetical protein